MVSARAGICREAARLLHNCKVAVATYAVLKKMTPLRQEEVAEHMFACGDYSLTFAKMLLWLTPPELLAQRPTSAQIKSRLAGRYPSRMKRLQTEAALLTRNLLRLRESYGRDVLLLTVYCKFVARILENRRVVTYLQRKHYRQLRVLLRVVHKAERRRTQVRRRFIVVDDSF